MKCNLDNLLQAKGLSRKEFSEQTGISRSYVTMLGDGTRFPSLEMAMKIAEALGVPVEIVWQREI